MVFIRKSLHKCIEHSWVQDVTGCYRTCLSHYAPTKRIQVVALRVLVLVLIDSAGRVFSLGLPNEDETRSCSKAPVTQGLDPHTPN